LALVSPSVVPNYYPTLRIVEYNMTGLEDYQTGRYPSIPAIVPEDEDSVKFDQDIGVWDDNEIAFTDDNDDNDDDVHDLKKRKKKKGKKGKSKKPPFTVPKPPSSTAPPGPAYSPQTFTWLSYGQYFANLTHINNESGRNVSASEQDADVEAPHLSKFKYELEYDTKHDKMYQMKDLTIRSYLDLAERMGRKKLKIKEEAEVEGKEEGMGAGMVKAQNKLWHAFVKRAFVLTKPDEELEDHFG